MLWISWFLFEWYVRKNLACQVHNYRTLYKVVTTREFVESCHNMSQIRRHSHVHVQDYLNPVFSGATINFICLLDFLIFGILIKIICINLEDLSELNGQGQQLY